MKPVAKYLSFTGNSGCYAELPLDVLAGATTFTIEAKFSTTSTKSSSSNYTWATIAGREIGGHWQDDFGICVNGGKLCFWAEPKSGGSSSTCNTTSNAIVNDGAIHEVAVVSADGAIDLYCDGELVAHTDNVNAKITDAYKILIAYNSDSDSRLQMDLYELRCWNIARSEVFADIDGTEDGLQAWYLPSEDGLKDYSGNERHATLYGSPTLNDVYYLPVNFSADVERRVNNVIPVEFTADVERKLLVKWRYVNAGTADTLTVTGTTLTDLPETKSVTGTAFYQRTLKKCFDIPATPEIWIKFDVYFDGSARWRAYNDRTGEVDTCGITAQTNGDLSFFANESTVQQLSGICTANQLQTVLLHMTAGSSDGVIEAWVDGEKIYTYTGDVNHGEDFADVYLQSGGAGTFFSNVIISNVEVGLGDGYQIFTADVERKVKNIVEETFGVHINAPIVVPLIGEHFNHYVRNITVYNGSPQKIILPKKGDVWISGIGAFRNEDIEIFTADGQSFYFGDPDIHFVDVDEIFIGYNYYGDGFATFDEFLFSDGDGNTRQIFSADIERTLIKTSENVFDVKILDVIPVEFTADVSRNILTTLRYFETDNSEYFSGGASAVTLPTQEFIPPMEETGLQSIEITLQEQQLTDQVKVVGVIPFDIMYPVRGQYLDYVYDMRVEKVQQQGILYSADCCVDIDEALYTQFNYCLDSDEDFIYFIPDYGTMSLVQVDHNDIDWEEIASNSQGLRKGFASKHFAKIANLLGKNFVCQFEDFASNMQERQSDVTFGDLISQLFGWSSRLPQRMINCYLRDDTLFAIQRGYERNVIDLTNAERTLPTFNRQLMRTFWGSGTSLKIEPTTQSKTVDTRRTMGGVKVYPWPPTSSPDGKTSYVYKNVSGYPGIETGYALESTTTRNDDGGKTVVSYGYDTVNNIYTCVSETSKTYDADGKKVDQKTTYHDRLTRSQQFTRVDDEDGNTVGSNVGSNLPGFYNECFWLRLPETVGSEDEIDKITGFNPLVDTEFPVCDPKVYPKLINAYIWLNRRTQETVTFSLYNCPHLIDSNDRIILDGAEYYLVRNTAKTTPRLYNEQNLTLVRWF